MLTQLSKDQLEVVSRNKKLTTYLQSLEKAVPTTKRTWLYDGQYGNPFLEPDAILSTWWNFARKKLSQGGNFLVKIIPFEESQMEKFGPQGGHKPMSEVLDDIVMPSFTLGQSQQALAATNDPDWEKAKSAVIAQFRRARVWHLRPSAPKNVVTRLFNDDKVGSNSGWPLFKRRRDPEAYKLALSDASSDGLWKRHLAIALFRYYNGKLRLVWMFPFSGNVHESTFYFPFQDAITKSMLSSHFYCPWVGFDAVRRRITDAYASGRMVCASDFSSTDAHFQYPLSSEVADVISAVFEPQFRDGIREVIEWMHNIPLVISPTQVLVGPHGVASGSSGTNLLETVADNIFGEWVALKTDGLIQPLYGIGDDMAWTVPAGTDPEFVKQTLFEYGSMIGQVIKPEKTTADPDQVKTLQRLFQRGFYRQGSRLLRGVYPTVRALKSLVWPERYHADAEDPFDKNDFCVRTFSILENCVDHPLFEAFVAFVCRGNRNLIPFARNDASFLDEMHKRSKRLSGLQVSYNQEKSSSRLSDFASIQVARRL